jgi:aryl carrier-like protein
VVVAVDGAQGRRLLANVVPRDHQVDDAQLIAQLRAWCETQLPAYLRPHAFAVLPALPLTASGKIDRRQLAQGPAEAPLTWPEGAPLARQLTVLWEQLLGIDALDTHDNLFDRGARSLTVVRALTELRRRGFHALRAVQIYEHPSVTKLAALLSAVPATLAPDAAAAARGAHQRAALARFGRRPEATS